MHVWAGIWETVTVQQMLEQTQVGAAGCPSLLELRAPAPWFWFEFSLPDSPGDCEQLQFIC